MAKKDAPETRATHTDKATISSAQPNGSSKRASANGMGQRVRQNGNGRSKAKNAANMLSKSPRSKASVRAHVTKANEYMLRGWQLISPLKDSES